MVSCKADPGEPLWQRSDNRLKGLTRAPETAATFRLPNWTNPPDDANQEDRGHLIDKTLSEMQEQLKALKEETDRAAKAKMSTCHKKAKDTDQNNTVNDKESKCRLKWQACHNKGKQGILAAKSIDLTSDDLDGHFGAFLNICSQETTSTMQEDSQPEPPKQDQQGDGKSSHDPAGSHSQCKKSPPKEDSPRPDASVSPSRSQSHSRSLASKLKSNNQKKSSSLRRDDH